MTKSNKEREEEGNTFIADIHAYGQDEWEIESYHCPYPICQIPRIKFTDDNVKKALEIIAQAAYNLGRAVGNKEHLDKLRDVFGMESSGSLFD